MLRPDTRHRHVRDAAQLRRQLARGPVHRSIGRFALRRPGQHLRFDPIGHLVALAPGVAGEQLGQPIGGKTRAPAIDLAVAAIELGTNLGPGQSIAEYRVAHLDVLDRSDTWVARNVDGSHPTLVTCWPFIALHAGGPVRYVVIADRT